MSSIYKKGRDGYYYYQTYVYNNDSKKKDKRIFHALGTKDLAKAKIKQSEFDLQYEYQNHTDIKISSSNSNFISKKKTKIVFLITMVFITYTGNSFYKNHRTKTKYQINSKVVEIDADIKQPFLDVSEATDVQDSSRVLGISDSFKQKRVEIKNIASIEKELLQNTTILEHNVIRVDRLSGAFEQGKLYVTVKQDLNKKNQLMLCNNLMKEYDEFTNIIICLYADNFSGLELARGNDEAVSVEEKKRSWLAMYSFNSVEGEYFDDNPSRYLGNY
tara:strand:- start:131 stop:952 length:822 start_codon:yes stop_codon:yes gene_type:complete